MLIVVSVCFFEMWMRMRRATLFFMKSRLPDAAMPCSVSTGGTHDTSKQLVPRSYGYHSAP